MEGSGMWHHKTKIGTFWIVESEQNHEYYLGLDEESLGQYKRIEDAIKDICEHQTGNLEWDIAANVTVPEDVFEWAEGEPENWNKI